MEDLLSVQVHKMDTLLEGQSFVQADDLISKAVFNISTVSARVMTAFQPKADKKKPVDVKEIQDLLRQAIQEMTVIMYCFEIEPPEVEEMESFADEFETVIAMDPILAALHIQRSLADIALDYFTRENEDDVEKEEIDTSVAEILSCIELIARRVGSNLDDLIIDI